MTKPKPASELTTDGALRRLFPKPVRDLVRRTARASGPAPEVEELRLDLGVYPRCAVCREPPLAERLVMDIVYDGLPATVVICQACLEEHAPHLLAAIQP